jgi:hypothetical protein
VRVVKRSLKLDDWLDQGFFKNQVTQITKDRNIETKKSFQSKEDVQKIVKMIHMVCLQSMPFSYKQTIKFFDIETIDKPDDYNGIVRLVYHFHDVPAGNFVYVTNQGLMGVIYSAEYHIVYHLTRKVAYQIQVENRVASTEHIPMLSFHPLEDIAEKLECFNHYLN